jgi:hypothetical protein
VKMQRRSQPTRWAQVPLTLAGIVLIGTSVVACSGSDGGGGDGGAGSTYCQDIASAKPIFEALSSGDLSQLEKGFTTFHELADEAPSDLKDEWKTLDKAATTIEGAIKEAGLKYDDLAGIQSGKIPEDVDMTKLAGFASDLQKLNSSDFADARTAISQHAKDTCDVSLGAL